jgi:hypothetical protein
MKVLVDDASIVVEDMELGAKEKAYSLSDGDIELECPYSSFLYKGYEIQVSGVVENAHNQWKGEITKVGDTEVFADSGTFRSWYNLLGAFRDWVDNGTMDGEYEQYKKYNNDTDNGESLRGLRDC